MPGAPRPRSWRLPGCQASARRGLADYRALGNRAGVSGSVSRLAGDCLHGRRFADAELLAREGVSLSLEAGSRTELALALLELGRGVGERGQVFRSPLCLAAEPVALHSTWDTATTSPRRTVSWVSICTWANTRRPTTIYKQV